ncbi:MAG: hypothetical protein R3E67_05420 [Pseudomonadales bacterium]
MYDNLWIRYARECAHACWHRRHYGGGISKPRRGRVPLDESGNVWLVKQFRYT